MVRSFIVGVAVIVGLSAGAAQSANVTPDVIFGNGNDNGSFTVDTANGVELGLRAKVRFDDLNQPDNVFNYDGVQTYSFDPGVPGGSGFGFAPNSLSTASWNFEWSINSDVAGPSDGPADGAPTTAPNRALSGLTYELKIDFDPGAGTNFLIFDPINDLLAADHALGHNSTGNGDGISDPLNFLTNISVFNVAQNSWNMEFFDGPGFPFINSIAGEYEFELAAFDGSNELARTAITVSVAAVPLPAALPLMASALALFGLLRLRRSRRPV